MPWKRRLGLRVAGVVNFHADGHEAFAAFLAATAEDIPAIFGAHALTEAELGFAGALGRLVGAFGHNSDEVK